MAEKSLKYFMREEAKEEKIFTVPGPDTIKDEKGNVVELKIRQLHNDRMEEIRSMYRTHTPLKDKKGNYVVQNGEVVYKSEFDAAKSGRRMLVEALAYPDLKDPDLMAFFSCNDITDMPLKVFPTNEEYAHVSRKVLEVLGISEKASDKEIESDIKEAKN